MLTFIFGPHGMNFSPKLELWVPRDMVDFDSLGTSFYSADGGEIVEEFDPSYNYTDDWVIFSIEHFSYYYYSRR
jgi:hypothetical protein